jgi:hypothetical protein
MAFLVALFRKIVAAGFDGVDPDDPTVDEGWIPNLLADELIELGTDGRYRITPFAAEVLPHVE